MSYDPLRKVNLGSNDMTVQCSTHLQATPSSYKVIQHDGIDCCRIPYEDHNYESCVASACIIGREKEDNFSEAPTVIIKSINKNTTGKAIKESMENNSGDQTRCICGFFHDDGYMICCDRCSVWQHIDCMEIDRNAIPDTYLCELCDPRKLNAEKARRLQQKKHREFLSNADVDSDELSPDLHSQTRSNISTQVDNAVSQLSQAIPNKRKRSAEAAKSSIHFNEARKRPRSKSFQCNRMEDEQEKTKCLLNASIRECSGSYQQLQGKNQYADCLKKVLFPMLLHNDQTSMQTVAQFGAKVEVHQESLQAQEDIVADKKIIEYLGNFMLTKTFEAIVGDIYEKPYPSVFFYNEFDGVSICVDARIYGSKAKFVRRSCCPNAEVRHVLSDGQLCLYIFSRTIIRKGDEITIPFDLEPDRCAFELVCACRSSQCWVSRLANTKTKCTKLTGVVQRISNKNLFEHQMKHYRSDKKKNPSLDDDSNTEIQKKKSREERKMEAYIRAFEDLEKRERRRSSLHQHPNEKSNNENVEPHQQQNSTSENFSQLVTSCSETISIIPTASSAETTSVIFAPTVLKSPVPAPGALKSRRQSTRARRPSAKLIDANGGLSNSYKSKGELNLSLLPVSEDSSDAANQEVARLLSLSITSKYENDRSDNSVPTCVGMELLENASMDPPRLLETDENTHASNITISDKENLQSNLTPSVRLENFDMSNYMKITDNLFRVAVEEEILPVSTTTVSEDKRNLKQTAALRYHAITTVDLNPVYPIVSCTFVPWNFQPGKPSGMVVINSTQQDEQRSIYSSSKYIKKWWLKRAVIDSKAVAAINSIHEQNLNNDCHNEIVFAAEEIICTKNHNHEVLNKQSIAANMSWKKRFIKRSNEKFGNTDCETFVYDATKDLRVKGLTENYDEKVNQPVREAINNTRESSANIDTGESSVISNLKASDLVQWDTNKISPVEETNVEVDQELEGANVEDNSSYQVLKPVNVEPNLVDTEYEIDDTLPGLSHGRINKSAAPVKRKVSYQEYMKRSKDGEKPVAPLIPNASVPETADKSLQQDENPNTVENHCMAVDCSTSHVEKSEDLQQMHEEHVESTNETLKVSGTIAETMDESIPVEDSIEQEDQSETNTAISKECVFTSKKSPTQPPKTEKEEKTEVSQLRPIVLDVEYSNEPEKNSVNTLEEGELPGNVDDGDNVNAITNVSPLKSRHGAGTTESFAAIPEKSLESSCHIESETSVDVTKSDFDKGGHAMTVTTAKRKIDESRICQSNKTFVKNRFWMNRSPSEQPNGYAQLPRASYKSQNNLMFSEWDSHNRRDEYPPPDMHSFNDRCMDDRRFYDNRQYADCPMVRRPLSPALVRHHRPYEHDFMRSRDFDQGHRPNHVRKPYDRLPNHSPPSPPDRRPRFQMPYSSGHYRNQWNRNYRR